MLSDNDLKLIEKLANSIGESSNYLIDLYSAFYLIHAVCWSLFGIGLILLPIKSLGFYKKLDNEGQIVFSFVKFLFVTIGLLLIMCNIPNILYPEAYAIKKLFIDIIR